MQETGYIASLDLGQANDFTALAVLRWTEDVELYTEYDEQLQGEHRLRLARGSRFNWGLPHPRAKAGEVKSRSTRYACGYLKRWPIGTRYPAIVSEVRDMLHRAELRGKTDLVIDRGGVGRAVFDLFTEVGAKPVGITITAGERANRTGGGWNVPKRDIVGVVQATMATGRLEIAPDLPDTPVLVKELGNFEVRVSQTGHASYEAAHREGAHDDLVLALACGVWFGENRPPKLDPHAFRPFRHL